VLTAVYGILKSRNGAWDTDHALSALAGYKAESPRGPIMIDPRTRDIIQNIYLRRVEKRDGQLVNVEFATIPMVRNA
jgi:branched-chain amino acid transport system substrate-binding protein